MIKVTTYIYDYLAQGGIVIITSSMLDQIKSDQLLSRVRLFATPWIAARQASTPRVHWDSRPSSQWCHPATSSSVIPFSSCPHSLPASESFPMSQIFAWGGQSTGVSALASFLPSMLSKCQLHIKDQILALNLNKEFIFSLIKPEHLTHLL